MDVGGPSPADKLVFYSVIAGADLDGVVEALATIVSANQTLAAYHRERRASLASA